MRGSFGRNSVPAACVLWAIFTCRAFAAGTEPAGDVNADPAACIAAAAADDQGLVEVCTALIDNEKAARGDRIKALIARGGAYQRKDMADRATADYDAALQLDPTLANVFNARGELWRRKGDRPKALADFAAAIKLNPDHAAAKASYKSLAYELERIGAMMAVAGKPTFVCASARRAVEKAICVDPELADLDRGIVMAYTRLVREAADPRARRVSQREQDDFIARRNASFGRPGYDLKKAMQERLDRLKESGAH